MSSYVTLSGYFKKNVYLGLLALIKYPLPAIRLVLLVLTAPRKYLRESCVLLKLWFRTIISVLVVLFAVLASVASYAEKTVDIYSANVLVINQTAEIRRKAAATALSTVLVRLSGSREVLQAPAVRDALRNASVYLYEFSYQTTDKTLTIAGASQPASRLVMRFSQTLLENLLRDAQLPLWSSNRPDILVWTVINNNGQRYVSAKSSMGRALKSAAINRGLPIANPVLDLEDRSALSVSRLWAMDEGSIRVASRRYDTDAVLAGRFSKDRNKWIGRFILLHQGKTTYYTASGESQSAAARSIIDKITDFMADIYAVVPGASGSSRSVLLQINNASDFSRYAEILTYLEKLPLVKSLNVARVDNEKLSIRVDLNTDIDRFLTTLKLDRKLKRVNQFSTATSVPLSEISVSLGQDGTTTSQVDSVVEKPHEFLWQ